MTEITLGARQVSRSACASDTGRLLDIYLGVCGTHSRPVRHEGTPDGGLARPGRYFITCPEDGGHQIVAERLVAVTTTVTCDGSCMSARRPSCDCGCGGMNHGRSWGTTVTREEYESALLTYRAEVDTIAARRQARQEATERKARKTFDTWAQEHADLITALEAHRRDDLGYPQPGSDDFLADLAEQVHRQHNRKPLTDNQVAAAHRTLARLAERQAQQAERKANARPAPEGTKIGVSGEIARIKAREGYMPGTVQLEAIVRCDGYAVQVTLPRALEDWARDNCRDAIYPRELASFQTHGPDYDGIGYRWTDALRGTHLEFIAGQITRWAKDETLGFAKRPTKVTFTPAEAA